MILALLLLSAGCSQPALEDPVVTVGDVALSELSLQAMTVNITVNVFNPNPIGADLKKVTFDVWYLEDTPHYLGHGEQSNLTLRKNGTTTVTLPVRISTVPAAQGVGSLLQNGELRIRLNGSAIIDLGLTTWEKPFEETRTFSAREFDNLLPATIPATGMSVSEGIQQIGGLLDAAS